MKSQPEIGFTLIELLVVIAIISLLSSVVLASLNGSRSQARYANVVQQMKAIEQAALQHEIATGDWAPDKGRGRAPAFVPEYLPKWPEPPCGVYDWKRGGQLGNRGVRIDLKETSSNIRYVIRDRYDNKSVGQMTRDTGELDC